MKRIWFLVSIVALMSCGEDDGPKTVNEPINRYYYGYMHYLPGIMPNTPKEKNLVTLEYENGRIVRRTGGIISSAPATGYMHSFSDAVYDTLVYSGDQLVIDKRAKPFLNELFKRTIRYSGEKMVQRVTERQLPIYTDTTDFFYDSSGKLIRSVTRGLYFPLGGSSPYQLESNYYYNGDTNLDSIVSLGSGSPLVMAHAVDVFTEYDQAANPLKGLMIFEEIFYRSLSENNYTSYKKKIYHPETGAVTVLAERTWDLRYDDEGQVLFDQY